jgi:hypothetical protein
MALGHGRAGADLQERYDVTATTGGTPARTGSRLMDLLAR